MPQLVLTAQFPTKGFLDKARRGNWRCGGVEQGRWERTLAVSAHVLCCTLLFLVPANSGPHLF